MNKMGLHKLSEALLDWLYPPACCACGKLLTRPFYPELAHRHFCPDCLKDLPFIPHPVCPVCGYPGVEGNYKGCTSCSDKTFAFVRHWALLAYDYPVREAIHTMKYRNRPDVAKGFGFLMAQALPESFPEQVDCMVPLPLHRRRLWQRGFNQSALLGKALSVHTGIPLDTAHCIRKKYTKPQFALNQQERQKNVNNAFGISPAGFFTGKTVLLIDDIFTTGSTANACAQTLMADGAAAVYVYTLCAAL